jgi:hypothetical protein
MEWLLHSLPLGHCHVSDAVPARSGRLIRQEAGSTFQRKQKENNTMRELTTITANNALQLLKQEGKAQPFAAQFTTKLDGVNSKLVCALSIGKDTCWDDACGGNPIC